jgi:hypothetical protein
LEDLAVDIPEEIGIAGTNSPGLLPDEQQKLEEIDGVRKIDMTCGK